MTTTPFATIRHQVQVCVVGGGLSGLCAAAAAARHGASVLLMHDRPVLGGNASSEIRMWVCGAHGDNNRETGIIEEILLENQYRNPDKNYSLWDSVLYSLARCQEGLTVLYNCACQTGSMEAGCLRSVTGFQATTQTWHQVSAELFIDCSGDSVLAPITGAPYRMGREGREEHGESIAPETADKKTMGLSCLLQARQETTASEFLPPPWACKLTYDDLAPYRLPNMDHPWENFWYLELGGEQDTIGDAETLRDALLAKALGIWDYVKNAPENKEKNRFWHLDWLGFLPGKRESRRYVGDYIMTQSDVETGGHFEDLIAYGGWSMDDHHPGGMLSKEPPTIYHPAPSPFGIPYRCLYSVSVDNLMFAGRNISVTHSALSSTRVMATCAALGQAAGTAAALAIENMITPRDVYQRFLPVLRRRLMDDDCYLPFAPRPLNALTDAAIYSAMGHDASVLKNGWDRPIADDDNGLHLPYGTALEMRLPAESAIAALRLVFDSDLNRATLPETRMGLNRPMPCNRPLGWPASCVPNTLVRAFRVEALCGEAWKCVFEDGENHQRLRVIPLHITARALRVTPLSGWGAEDAHLFAADLLSENHDAQ